MNANKSEEELLDYREDEQLSDLNSDLQDGAGSPRGSNNNNNQTPASSQEISLLTSAIQLLPGPLNSSLVEEKRHEKGKGKRPASSAANAVPAKNREPQTTKRAGRKTP